MKIFLDMDGVLCDFDSRFNELFGERPDDEDHRRKHFWDNWKVFVDGNHFETLPVHPDAYAIMQVVRSINAPTYILSSSGGGYSHEMVIEQKKKWLADHGLTYPAYFVPGGKYKTAYAEPEAVLIDDMERNITLFNEAGGVGILHVSVENTLYRLLDVFNKEPA